jgi:hypothetical protein
MKVAPVNAEMVSETVTLEASREAVLPASTVPKTAAPRAKRAEAN